MLIDKLKSYLLGYNNISAEKLQFWGACAYVRPTLQSTAFYKEMFYFYTADYGCNNPIRKLKLAPPQPNQLGYSVKMVRTR